MIKDPNNIGSQQGYFSIYKGEVADRKDPNRMGRIKVILRPIFGETVHDYWAEPKGMFTGAGTGAIFIPQVGDFVWITFEGGDHEYPVWEYGPYQDRGAIQDLYDSDGEPTRSIIQTKSGHRIVMDDTNGYIEVKDSHGNYIRLNENGISHVSTDAISLGTLDGSAEPAVLGDKNGQLHNDHLQGIIVHTHYTAMGPSSTPINVATFNQLVSTVEGTKSKKVTLD